jgi:hypothetical protein
MKALEALSLGLKRGRPAYSISASTLGDTGNRQAQRNDPRGWESGAG